jgi:hypothetical protein
VPFLLDHFDLCKRLDLHILRSDVVHFALHDSFKALLALVRLQLSLVHMMLSLARLCLCSPCLGAFTSLLGANDALLGAFFVF